MQHFLCSVYCREHAGCCWSRENTAQNWVSGRLFCSSLFSSTCKNWKKTCKTLQNTVRTLQNTAKHCENTAEHCRNLAKHCKTLPLVAPNRSLVAPRGWLGWAGGVCEIPQKFPWAFVESHKPWLAGWLGSGAPVVLHHCCTTAAPLLQAGWLAGWLATTTQWFPK